MKKIGIINYGLGNLRSIEKAFQRLNYSCEIINSPSEIINYDKFILPGVGHFEKGMSNLKQLGFIDSLNETIINKKKPVLGICLGMQLMAKHSAEGNIKGLGWIDADVIKFKVSNQLKYKVPHMGWNNAIIEKNSPLFKGITSDAMYYFVHSYYIKCHQKEDILTTTEYDYPFTSSIQKNNIFGTQFHPEKSHDWGEKILKNFVEI